MTLGELNKNFDEIMCGGPFLIKAKGFTIGRGKKLYWYIIGSRAHRSFRCVPVEANGRLGWARTVKSDTKVTVVPVQ